MHSSALGSALHGHLCQAADWSRPPCGTGRCGLWGCPWICCWKQPVPRGAWRAPAAGGTLPACAAWQVVQAAPQRWLPLHLRPGLRPGELALHRPAGASTVSSRACCRRKCVVCTRQPWPGCASVQQQASRISWAACAVPAGCRPCGLAGQRTLAAEERPRSVQRASSSTRSPSTWGAARRMLRSSSAASKSLICPAASLCMSAPEVWSASQHPYTAMTSSGTVQKTAPEMWQAGRQGHRARLPPMGACAPAGAAAWRAACARPPRAALPRTCAPPAGAAPTPARPAAAQHQTHMRAAHL